MPTTKLSQSKSKLKSKASDPDPTVEQQLEALSAINPTSNSDSSSNSSNTSTNFNHGSLTHDNLPTFNPSQFLANNLFADSSTLPKTTKVEADKAIQSIQEKRETLRIVGTNLQLNTDALKVGSLSEKMSQAAIDYSSSKIGTDIKLINLEAQKVNYAIAGSKLGQVSEKLNHENITLEGLRLETDQRRRFWAEKYNLGESRIAQVQLAKYQLDAKIGAIEAEAESVE